MALSTRTKGITFGSLTAIIVAVGAAVIWLERSPQVSGPVEIVQPTTSELETVAGTRVLFGHQSVGANILSGVDPVFTAGGVGAPQIVETREAIDGTGGAVAHVFVGVNGDPFGKFADFTSVIDGPLGDDVDVAILKLCYADLVSTADPDAVFNAYVEMMEGLEARHPDVTFLYATAPVTQDLTWKQQLKLLVGLDDQMGPKDNVVRQRYNTLIREKYGDTGRLFDVAAIEATLSTTPMTRDLDGQPYVVLNPALAIDGGHLNDQGSQAAAAELVRVIAANVGQ